MGFKAEEFRTLVERHQSMVYSIALRITGDPGTAEEVAQDAFLALYRTANQPHEEDHVRFWLRKVATHGALDALRREKCRPEAGAEEWVEERWIPEEQEAKHTQSGAAFQDRVEDLLKLLPESQRASIVLRYGEDMRPEEIAVVLGQPVATVKSHLQRGLAMLRKKAVVVMKEYLRDV